MVMSVDIFYQNTIIHISVDNVSKASLAGPFMTIKSLFCFKPDDVVVVIRAGAVHHEKVHYKIMNNINQIVDKNHLHFFIEDLFTTDTDPPELDLIKKISKYFNLEYTIYHCEKNNFTKYFDWYVADSVLSLTELPSIHQHFSKKICCLNRRYTDYRYLASAFLSNYANDVSLTQHYSLSTVENSLISVDKLDYKLNIKTGLAILHGLGRINNQQTPIDVDYTSKQASDKLIAITQNCFCSLITESKFHSGMPNFSEKTLRAIISGRPFVLLAPVGTLQLLKDLGFKTFSKFWDESYDLELDSTKRFEKAMFVVKEILEKESLDIEPMMSILEHNQQHLASIPKQMYRLLNQRP
jgi:hypothetical protein